MTLLAPTMPPLGACREYLKAKLAERTIALPIGVDAPATPEGAPGPTHYALVSQLGSNQLGPVGEYLLRVKVFNADAWTCAQHALFLHAALLGAAQTKIVVPGEGSLWVTGTEHQMGPADLDDPDVPLFGQQMAVFWTTPLKPIEGVQP